MCLPITSHQPNAHTHTHTMLMQTSEWFLIYVQMVSCGLIIRASGDAQRSSLPRQLGLGSVKPIAQDLVTRHEDQQRSTQSRNHPCN